MPNERWNEILTNVGNNIPSTISGLNRFPMELKRKIYSRLIPKPILDRFDIPEDFVDQGGNDLLNLVCDSGSPFAELALFHRYGFQDPIVYGQVTDTINGQIHIMLYVINDPMSQRFDVDRLPDGTPTEFGILHRNIAAEIAAMRSGLAPGQIRSGLRMLNHAIEAFESFAVIMSHDKFFAEPLYYHNAVILERAGFAYLKGKRLMEWIDRGFAKNGELSLKLDGSNPFRMPEAANGMRLRSWALHDGVMEQNFRDVTMYRNVGKDAGIKTTSDINW